ncbi:MAG TPA: hypothetical protein VIK69_02475 [Methylophilaceae bacterium]|jgi:hypothetical protein
MLRGIRNHYVGLITSFGHLALLVIAVQHGRQPQTAWIVGLIGLISLFAWASSFRRKRLIADTPTSRIGSAAQGYVELYGRAVPEEDNLIRSPISGLPCVWYRYRIYQRQNGNKWHQIAQGVSDSIFQITDGTGRCFVDPDHAEVIGAERRVMTSGDLRRVEELLFGHAVYVLGEFSTQGGADVQLDPKADVAALLAEWKCDREGLLQRFDLDGNGEIDLQEWELARRAAQREVERQHREIRAQSGVHVIRAPRDGRLFILSNHSPQQLRNMYLRWSLWHLAIVVASAIAIVWLLA